MGQIIVRKIDGDLKERLKRRAVSDGISIEEEVRMILQDALLKDEATPKGLGTRIAELFRDIEGNDEPLPEFPRSPLKPPRFED